MYDSSAKTTNAKKELFSMPEAVSLGASVVGKFCDWGWCTGVFIVVVPFQSDGWTLSSRKTDGAGGGTANSHL